MTKKNKIRICGGIALVLLVIIFVLSFVIIPIIISKKEPCNMFSSYGNIKMCSFGGMVIVGSIISFLVGLPLATIGISLIDQSLLNWKKIKNPRLATFCILLLMIIVSALVIMLVASS